MKPKRTTPKVNSKSVRASVTLSIERYRELEMIAGEKKVSVAWVVREALDRYVTDRWPLLSDK
jgi:predicted DNA-binding ribbon-helix-helix protein